MITETTINLSNTIHPEDIKFVSFIKEKGRLMIVLTDKNDQSSAIVMQDNMVEGLVTQLLEFYNRYNSDHKNKQLILKLEEHRRH